MPLSERARIEVYLPDLPRPAYQRLLTTLEQELCYTFGGCTTIRNLDGRYLSQAGHVIADRVHHLYTDAPISFDDHSPLLAGYADELRRAAHEALDEEAILVAVHRVFHAE